MLWLKNKCSKLIIVPLILFLLISFSIPFSNKVFLKFKPYQVKAQACTHTVSNDEELANTNNSASAGQTVCLKPGIYNVQIKPLQSGNSENRITYKSEASEKATLTQKIDLENKSYITVSDLIILATQEGRRYLNLDYADHIIIENCELRPDLPDLPRHPPVNMNSTSYSIIRNNHLVGTNLNYNDLINMYGDSHHNLIEGNRFEQGSHTNLLMSGGQVAHNIVRQNFFINDYHHCINVMYQANNNVFDGNIFARCGSGIAEGPFNEITGSSSGDFHAWQSEGIYRRNLILNSGRKTDYDGSSSDDLAAVAAVSSTYINDPEGLVIIKNNRWYHNTIFGNYGKAFNLGIYYRAFNYEDNDYHDNKFVNNILYDNGVNELEVRYVHYYETPAPSPPTVEGDQWRHNLIGNPGEKVIDWQTTGEITLTEAETLSNPIFQGNISADPKFNNIIQDSLGIWGKIDPGSDFRLSDSSAAIDAGDFLTYTDDSGSGTDIPVNDAGFFIDGFGIIDGDIIVVGKNSPVKITNVDYTNNIITVDRNIGWNNNDPVTFPYSGPAPDIGAFEYLSETDHCQPLGNIDCNTKANTFDFGYLVRYWGLSSYPAANLDDSGVVDKEDALIFLRNYGK